MDQDDPTITSLVEDAVGGDEDAWNELVDRYSPLIVAVTHGWRLSAPQRQDVAQTVWLRLVERLGSLREPRALPMWIITTTKREAMRVLSAERRTEPLDPLSMARRDSADRWTDPVEGLIQLERHEALLAGLAELPARQRQLLFLLVQDPPPTYQEINRLTGIPIGSIGPTRSRALARLRQTSVMAAQLAPPGAAVAGGDPGEHDGHRGHPDAPATCVACAGRRDEGGERGGA